MQANALTQASSFGALVVVVVVLSALTGSCRGTLPPTEPHAVEAAPESRTNDSPALGPLTGDGTGPSAAGSGGTSVLPIPSPGPGGGGGTGGGAGSGIH